MKDTTQAVLMLILLILMRIAIGLIIKYSFIVGPTLMPSLSELFTPLFYACVWLLYLVWNAAFLRKIYRLYYNL